MKKGNLLYPQSSNNVIIVVVFSSVVLIGFGIAYRRSGKFRQSLTYAVIWAIVALGGFPTFAKEKNPPSIGADTFTQPAQSRSVN